MRYIEFSSLFSLLVLAIISHAQVPVETGMTADAHCGKGYCFTAVYSPQNRVINYTLIVPKGGPNSGWFGVAQGSEMKGANMAINWVNTDSSLTTSHRSATGETYPIESLASSLPALTVNSGVITSTIEQTVWSWNFAHDDTTIASPSSKMSHIFASSQASPLGKEPSSGIPMHDYYEYPIILDMTKPYNGGAPAGLRQENANDSSSIMTVIPSSSRSNGMRDLSLESTRLILVHMIFMVLAWMMIVPAGILVARYGRTFFAWFPVHQTIQIIGAIFIFLASILALVAVGKSSSGNSHFSSKHGKSGLVLLIIYGQQLLLGVVAHYYKSKTGKRYIGYIHMPLGIILMAMSVYTIHLGFDHWNWDPPKAASYFLYAWSGFLFIVYLAGFALLSKERKQMAKKQQKEEHKQASVVV